MRSMLCRICYSPPAHPRQYSQNRQGYSLFLVPVKARDWRWRQEMETLYSPRSQWGSLILVHSMEYALCGVGFVCAGCAGYTAHLGPRSAGWLAWHGRMPEFFQIEQKANGTQLIANVTLNGLWSGSPSFIKTFSQHLLALPCLFSCFFVSPTQNPTISLFSLPSITSPPLYYYHFSKLNYS